MATKEELQHETGTIGRLEEIDRSEVSVEGEIVELWDVVPEHATGRVVEDETGMTKFTVWKASRQPVASECGSERSRRTGTRVGARSH